MQMFSASSFVLFKTIKYIYTNNAVNDRRVLLLTTLGQALLLFLNLTLKTWKIMIQFNT